LEGKQDWPRTEAVGRTAKPEGEAVSIGFPNRQCRYLGGGAGQAAQV